MRLPFPSLVAASLVLLLAACGREPAPGRAAVFPALAESQHELQALRLRGAGNRVLVTLSREGAGNWRVAERDAWPADAGRLSQYLFVLSQAKLAEPKTADPKLYTRIGVEPVSRPAATGVELELVHPEGTSRLLIGDEHARLNANYVRVDGQAQSWLTDLPVTFARDPAEWLDRSLVELPLARIARVSVEDASRGNFSLSHRDDRFRIDGVPSAAMGDSYAGDSVAAALGQLQLDDVAPDEGRDEPERTLRFLTVEGIALTLQLWPRDGRTWARLSAEIDPSQAAEWARAAKADAGKARAFVAAANRRFQGRRFLLPVDTAATLLLGREQILAGGEGA